MGFDQRPVYVALEQRIDMLVTGRFVGPVEGNVSPGPHARHQRDAKEAAKPEDGFALAMRVGVQDAWLDRGWVVEQAVQNMHGLPNAAGNEGREQRDIVVGDVVVGDAAVAAIADVPGTDEIVLTQHDVRAVRDGRLPGTPVPGQ